MKLIIKPLIGVDCEDIVIIERIEDLTLDLDKIFKPWLKSNRSGIC